MRGIGERASTESGGGRLVCIPVYLRMTPREGRAISTVFT